MKVYCPETGAEIPADKINAAEDIAISPASGTVYKLSELIAQQRGAEVDPAVLSDPPAGAWYRRDPNAVHIGARMFHPAAFFILFFSIAWNSFIVTFFVNAPSGNQFPPVFFMLFMLPFVGAGLFTAGLALYGLFGRQDVLIAYGQARIFKGVGPLGKTRRFDPASVTEVTEKQTTFTNERTKQQSNVRLGIAIKAGGKTIGMGLGLSQAKRDFLLAALRDALLNNHGRHQGRDTTHEFGEHSHMPENEPGMFDLPRDAGGLR